MSTGTLLDIKPSHLPPPDLAWFAPEKGDFFAGFLVMTVVVLFSVLLRKISKIPTNTEDPGSPKEFETLRTECLKKIRSCDIRSDHFWEEVWNAVREFLSRTGKIPSAKTLTAEEFAKKYAFDSIPEIAMLARHLSYASPLLRSPKESEKLRESAEIAVSTLS